jgi:hypothetical protein
VPPARIKSQGENRKKMGNILLLKVRLLGCDSVVWWIFIELEAPATLIFRVIFIEITHRDNHFKY